MGLLWSLYNIAIDRGITHLSPSQGTVAEVYEGGINGVLAVCAGVCATAVFCRGEILHQVSSQANEARDGQVLPSLPSGQR